MIKFKFKKLYEINAEHIVIIQRGYDMDYEMLQSRGYFLLSPGVEQFQVAVMTEKHIPTERSLNLLSTCVSKNFSYDKCNLEFLFPTVPSSTQLAYFTVPYLFKTIHEEQKVLIRISPYHIKFF